MASIAIHRASIDAPIDRCTDRSLFLSNLASRVDRFSRLDRALDRRLPIDVAIASNLAPRVDDDRDRRVDRRANEWLRFIRPVVIRSQSRDATRAARHTATWTRDASGDARGVHGSVDDARGASNDDDDDDDARADDEDARDGEDIRDEDDRARDDDDATRERGGRDGDGARGADDADRGAEDGHERTAEEGGGVQRGELFGELGAGAVRRAAEARGRGERDGAGRGRTMV